MSSGSDRQRHRALLMAGLGTALLMAVLLSPFASKAPDGLDRVSQDLKFDQKEMQAKPAQKLPFYAIFNEYALRGVPAPIAKPLAGLAGTLVTFGLAWSAGKLLVRNPSKRSGDDSRS